MAFRLVQHPDLEVLAVWFARDVSHRPGGLSPLDSEPLIVQTAGMEKWLALQCARLNGSFSRVETFTPVQYLMKLGYLALGQTENRTVFEKDILPWALLRILQQDLAADAPEVRELAAYAHESPEDRSLRLFSLASTLADLYDQYLLYRPGWLEAWKLGQRLFPDRSEEVWQAHLWRRLQEQAGGVPTRADFFGRLKAELEDPQSDLLPPRVFLFGLSLLPERFLEVFALLGKTRDVTLYLQLPSLHYWGDLEPDRLALKRGRLGQGNRLLGNLGTLMREFMDLLLLHSPDTPDTYDFEQFPWRDDLPLLGRIRQDLLLCSDGNLQPVALPAGDKSLHLARCPSPLREVEVLHDRLLDALADPTLKGLSLSDILVVTPDPETYGPLVEQVFGSARRRCGVELAYSLADRSPLQEDRALRLARDLLEACTGDASPAVLVPLFEEACDLAGTPLEARERELLAHWVRQGGIRRDFGPGELTWQAGLDRLMAGYALDGDEPLPAAGELYPLHDGMEALPELAGRLAEFVGALADLGSLEGQSHPLAVWLGHLLPLLGRLLPSAANAEEALAPLTQASLRLQERLEVSGSSGDLLGWALVLRSLVDELAQPDAGGTFLSGRITVAGMVPLRSLPFRVIAVLGLNQGAFPRHRDQPEYDLMRENRKTGDRDSLNADRYLFLELLGSAHDRLILTSSGRLEDGSAAPLSSVAELLISWLDGQYLLGEVPAGQAITMSYPLSPGSARYRSLHPDDQGLVTWNQAWFSPRPDEVPPRKLWDWRADERGGATVDAYRVLRRLASPVKAFLEEGLQARGVGSGDELPRTEMFFPDRLEEHNLREAILNQLRHGDVWSLGRLAASGGLPPGLAGRFVRQSEERGLASRLEAVSLVLGQSPVFRSVTLECPLADRTLRWEGELARGDGLQVVLDAGRMKGKRWLSLGLAHAAACVHEPWTTVYVALDQTPRLSLWSPSVAADQLHAWVALADQTLSRALPLDLDAAWFWCRNPELPRAERLAETWALAKKNAAYDGTFLTALGESESWAEAGLEDDFVALAEAVFGSWAAMVQGVRS